MSAVTAANLATLHADIGKHLTNGDDGLESLVWDYDDALAKAPRPVVVGHYLGLAFKALRTGEVW